jgi:hypothetical protein
LSFLLLGLAEVRPDWEPDCEHRNPTSFFASVTLLLGTVLKTVNNILDRATLKILFFMLIIDAEKMSVECYRLNERGKWELTPYS